MTEPNRRAVGWSEIETMTMNLARKIMTAGGDYDVIIGIARGGMIPASLLAKILPHGMILSAHLKRYELGTTESTAFPKILAFPPDELLFHKKVLIVDEVWDYGDTIIGAIQRANLAEPHLLHTAVLHFKPTRNRYPHRKPTYAVEETADWIDYPWEVFESAFLANTPTS